MARPARLLPEDHCQVIVELRRNDHEPPPQAAYGMLGGSVAGRAFDFDRLPRITDVVWDTDFEPATLGRPAMETAAPFGTFGGHTGDIENTIARARVPRSQVAKVVAAAESHPQIAKISIDLEVEHLSQRIGDGPVGTVDDVRQLLGTPSLRAAGLTGRGVAVAVVDNGICLEHLRAKGANPALDTGGSWSYRNTCGLPSVAPGKAGPDHGTMCAFGVTIAAPECTLLDVVFLDHPQHIAPTAAGGRRNLTTWLSDAAKTFIYLREYLVSIQSKASNPSLVVTNSWGVYDPTGDVAGISFLTDRRHTLNVAVEVLESFGADVIFAAGNCGGPHPAKGCRANNGGMGSILGVNGHPSVLTVGGVNIHGERVAYSSTGPSTLGSDKPDVCGYTHFAGSRACGPCDVGTSTAAPLVAGLVAALRTHLPYDPRDQRTTSPEAIRNLLRQHAKRPANSGFNTETGWGIADLSRWLMENPPLPGKK